MRRTKFRAWNTDDEMMYPVLSVNIEDGTCEVDGDDLGLTWRDDARSEPEAILMQFTGLHDKNGKEIWEADIVCDGNGEQFTVVFNDGSFWAKHREMNPYVFGSSAIEGQELGVVGNVYENPSLLTTSAPASSDAAEQAAD